MRSIPPRLHKQFRLIKRSAPSRGASAPGFYRSTSERHSNQTRERLGGISFRSWPRRVYFAGLALNFSGPHNLLVSILSPRRDRELIPPVCRSRARVALLLPRYFVPGFYVLYTMTGLPGLSSAALCRRQARSCSQSANSSRFGVNSLLGRVGARKEGKKCVARCERLKCRI